MHYKKYVLKIWKGKSFKKFRLEGSLQWKKKNKYNKINKIKLITHIYGHYRKHYAEANSNRKIK